MVMRIDLSRKKLLGCPYGSHAIVLRRTWITVNLSSKHFHLHVGWFTLTLQFSWILLVVLSLIPNTSGESFAALPSWPSHCSGSREIVNLSLHASICCALTSSERTALLWGGSSVFSVCSSVPSRESRRFSARTKRSIQGLPTGWEDAALRYAAHQLCNNTVQTFPLTFVREAK